MLERMEGFRLMVFGLVLLGVGAAVIWKLQWLFYWRWASASSRSWSRARSSPSGVEEAATAAAWPSDHSR